jgi:hypothetical protein
LQLLLVLASVVILVSESRGTHAHILLSQIRDSPNPEGQVPVFVSSQGTGWPSYTPRHWVPILSPPTTRRATVEVFDPASTRETLLIKSQVTLQSVSQSWCRSPSGAHDQIFIIVWHLPSCFCVGELEAPILRNSSELSGVTNLWTWAI